MSWQTDLWCVCFQCHCIIHIRTYVQLIDMSDEASEWYKDQGHIRAIFDLAICSGIIMKPPVDAVDPSAAVAVSILATPSYFPKELFVHAEDIQPGLNSLIDTVSRQHDFIAGALEKLV